MSDLPDGFKMRERGAVPEGWGETGRRHDIFMEG